MILRLIGGPLDGQERNYDTAASIQWLLTDAHNMAEYKRGEVLGRDARGEVNALAYHFTGRTEAAHS
jgi:hypothetical protein